ncbi:HU family DNA-binding protein [Breznakiellaceae bacterium SP9]
MSIQFYLKSNQLQAGSGYVAQVFRTVTVTEKELCSEIALMVTGLTLGQVGMVIDAYNRCVGVHLKEGRNVHMELFSMSFSMHGLFATMATIFNPLIHKIMLHVRLNKELSEAAKQAVPSKHEGVVQNGPVIDEIIDLSTGIADNATHIADNATHIAGSETVIAGNITHIAGNATHIRPIRILPILLLSIAKWYLLSIFCRFTNRYS